MRQGRSEALASGLGWFSIGLGVAELLAPRFMARAAGVEAGERMTRLCGAREIAVGIGLLAARDKTPWMWGRVAGDALDLAVVSAGSGPKAAAALGAVAGITALDVAAARRLGERRRPRRIFDYSDRSGFPRPAHEMRGLARAPTASRSWTEASAVQPAALRHS
jgi:hypothetical protein